MRVLWLLFILLVEDSKGDHIDESSLSDDVDNFIYEFFMMSTSSSFPLEDVERASDGHMEWLNTIIPIVRLISKASNSSFEPFSNETLALTKLHVKVMEIMEKINIKEATFENDLETVISETMYQKEVGEKLMEFRLIFKKIIHPFFSEREMHRQQFIELCSSSSGPQSIIDFMESVYMTNCVLPNKNSTLTYVKLLKALREFEQNQGDDIRNSLTYEEAKRELLTLSDDISRDEIISKLQDITNSTRHQRFKDQYECILVDILNAYSYKRSKIESVIAQLRLHMLQTEMFLLSCSDMSTGDALQQMAFADQKVKQIFSYICKYVPLAQKLAFPLVSIEQSMLALGTTKIRPNDYNSSAEIVQLIFEERGLPLEHFQIFITESISNDEYSSNISLSNNIFFHHQDGDIFVHVIKYEIPIWDRLDKAAVWLLDKRDEIISTLKTSHLISNASEIMESLQHNFSIVHPERFHAATLLKRSHLWPEDTTIPVGLACLNVDYHSSCEVIELNEIPSASFSHRLVLYLFS